jgi:hypothetical protein
MTVPLPVSESHQPVPTLAPPKSAMLLNVVALAVALLALAGSFWLRAGLDSKVGALAYYQWSFMIAVASILLLAQLTELRASSVVSVLAMPVAMAGLALAVYHVERQLAGKLESPPGLFGFGSAPVQSLVAQAVLVIVLLIAGIRRPVLAVGIALGILLGYACVQSAASV